MSMSTTCTTSTTTIHLYHPALSIAICIFTNHLHICIHTFQTLTTGTVIDGETD
jgi:hypothetical protein